MTLPQGFHSTCEAEPIHLPGAVQPHGVVIALADDLSIVAVSASSEPILGVPPRDLVGKAFGELFGRAAEQQVVQSIAFLRNASLRTARIELTLRGAAIRLDCRAHLSGSLAILDLEPVYADADSVADHVHRIVAGLAGLRNSIDVEPIATGLARVTRQLTGFDRVMVYRFDPDWNGEVIAEAATPGATSYLGLHFPASDIPKQARELYVSTEIRHIPDARYTPSPLVRADGVGPVDLGLSALRSVSPAHLEYMHNMGVRASLVGSLLRDGKLWGLIACHQLHQARFVSSTVRDLFQWVCQDGATLITKAKRYRLGMREAELAHIQTRLLDRCREIGMDGLLSGPSVNDLLEVAAADGFAWLSPEGLRTAGLAPSAALLEEFRRRLRAGADAPASFVSHRLRAEFGHAPLGESIAGVLFAPIDGPHGSGLAWFRAERRRDVQWGGDPARPVNVEADGTVSPRKSFAAYLETVDGQALPWRPEEVASARRMEALLDIEAQRRLKSKSDLLQVALAQLDERVVITDAAPIDRPGPRIIMVTTAVEQATGYSAEELIGATPRIFQGPETDRSTLDRLRNALERGQRIQVDLLNYTKDGRRVWVDLDIAPVRAESGRITHWIAIQRDITERKNTEREISRQRDELKALADELQQAKQAADRANEAKSLFLANMSHELRTPMHAILSFSKLGLERVDEIAADKLKRYFSNIRDSGERLTRLLNDLLDLSKLEAGRMQMNPEQVDVRRIVEECRAEFDPLFAAKSLRFEFRKPPTPLNATLDATRIGQVVRNLLSNAIKFSPEAGRIELALDTGEDGAEPGAGHIPAGWFRLSVVDEGIGIPESELEDVFDKFVQSSKTHAGYEGTGLGLAICREIVSAHGGTIRALPTDGPGSRFEMMLPLRR